MFIKNFRSYKTDVYDYENFTALRRDGTYLFPYYCKLITWGIIVSSVVASCTVLVLYGLSFGLIKFYLWVTAFFTSFLIGLFITAPIRLFFFSIINSVFRRVRPIILQRRIRISFLVNPCSSEKRIRVLKFRKYNAHLYAPIPVKNLENRLEDIKYNIELRNLTADINAYFLFMLTVFYLVLYNKSPLTFHSNELIKDLIVNGSYENTITLKDIITYETFVKYLNETLLPALLPDRKEIKNDRFREEFKRKRRSWDSISERMKAPPNDIRKRQILHGFNNLREADRAGNVFSRGWTVNPNIKLMGKPRLRQVRVKSGTCKELEALETRNSECAGDMTIFNIETGTFSLNWEPSSPKGLNDSQALPWRHQSMGQTKTLPVIGIHSMYPAGGYVLDLARNIEDARIVLDFMDAFQWVDFKTRAIFVEFTLYCVNTNLFTVVTILIEKPATGYIIPSYQINTCKFLFLNTEVEVLTLVTTVLFALLIFAFFLRESVRISRTSLRLYLTQGFAVLDLITVILGVLTVLFLILRYIYVSSLLKELEKAENNKFVSFIFAATWHSWSLYIEALLVCLASFKVFRLLTFRVIYYQYQTTLGQSYRHYVDLIFLQLILILAFAFFFNLALVCYSKEFSTPSYSITTLIGRTVALDNSFDFSLFSNTPWYLGPLFFAVFVCFCAILLVNMFIAVICLYFHIIRNTHLKNKYNVFEYMKYFATIKRQKDIMHLDEQKFLTYETTNKDIMRLKGGGSKMSVRKTKMKRLKDVKGMVSKKYLEQLHAQAEKELKSREELRKINLSEFVIKKPYDTLNYRGLAEDRALALKNLILMILTQNVKTRTVLREKALKALFLTHIMGKRNLKDIPGDYFFVQGECGVQVYSKSRISQMKKVIEDVGRKNNVLITEDECNAEMTAVEEKLDELEEKLSFLCEEYKAG